VQQSQVCNPKYISCMGLKRYVAGVSMSNKTGDTNSELAATNAGVSLSNETGDACSELAAINAAVSMSKETEDAYSELAATNGTGV
jgi:hypothetical protein